MSEYKPITDGLRGSMKRVQIFGSPFVQKEAIYFDQMCDNIDAIHANLERENEGMKAELDRARGELPKDADGEYIHFGDVMVYADGYACPLPVVALVPPAVFLTEDGTRHADMCRHHQPDTWEHIEDDATMPPGDYVDKRMTVAHGTIETVDEAFEAMACDLVARCKALAGDAE